jgi:hypothetical protein
MFPAVNDWGELALGLSFGLGGRDVVGKIRILGWRRRPGTRL